MIIQSEIRLNPKYTLNSSINGSLVVDVINEKYNAITSLIMNNKFKNKATVTNIQLLNITYLRTKTN